MNICVW